MASGIWLRIGIARTDLTFEPKMSQNFQLQYKTTNNSLSQGETVQRQVQYSWHQQQHETITTEEKNEKPRHATSNPIVWKKSNRNGSHVNIVKQGKTL